MIAKLRGLVDAIGEDWAVIDVGGVGYLVYASGRTLSALPPPGQAAVVHVETHVREDHIHLYGFAEALEREWFRLLITVQGVGSKVALAILSVMTPEQLSQAIVAQDKTMLTRASGVGPRLATRILSELKDKAAGLGAVPFAPSAAAAAVAGEAPAAPVDAGPLEDAISALVNLGYRRVEAHAAVTRAAQALGGEASVQALIREGLKDLGREAAR